MDDADIAQLEVDTAVFAAIKKIEPVSTDNPSGACLNCAEEIGTDRRWCDNSCRDDWVKRQGLWRVKQATR